MFVYMKKIIFLFIFFLIFSPVYATMIIETWHGHISNVNNHPAHFNPLVEVGDTFNIYITYNSEGEILHSYSDGKNEIAEFGLGDDVIIDKVCTGSSINNVDCSRTGYAIFLSDAIIDASELYSLLFDSSLYTPYDYYSFNKSYRFKNINDVDIFELYDDDFYINASTEYSGTIGGGQAAAYHEGLVDWDLNHVEFEFDSVIVDRVGPTVPEPSTLTILSLGLLGLFNFRRNSKAH